LTRTFDRTRVNPLVCSLSREVPLADAMPDKANGLVIVQKRGKFDFTTIFRVARLLRGRADVVHSFLCDAEIVARLAAPFGGRPLVVASERNTDYVHPPLRKLAFCLTRGLFDVMVANSQAGKTFNVRTMGIAPARIEVVHNGVDARRFRPDPDAGRALRQSLGISPADLVVGMVGNFKRQKNHACFLRMARRVQQTLPQTWFLVAGEVVQDNLDASSRYQQEVKELAASLHLGDRCRFLGGQKNVQTFYNACDLTTLLSWHEGNPNVVLESMACGVPIIASDIADNALIVQDGITGRVVPKDDSEAAAQRVMELLAAPATRAQMAAAARRRVEQEFTMERAARKLEDIYHRHLARKRKQPAPDGIPSPLRGGRAG
jgi:glycosyltransferase involved in cell wall biosynthesis